MREHATLQSTKLVTVNCNFRVNPLQKLKIGEFPIDFFLPQIINRKKNTSDWISCLTFCGQLTHLEIYRMMGPIETLLLKALQVQGVVNSLQTG